MCVYHRARSILLSYSACRLSFKMSVNYVFVWGFFPSISVGNTKQNMAANPVTLAFISGRVLYSVLYKIAECSVRLKCGRGIRWALTSSRVTCDAGVSRSQECGYAWAVTRAEPHMLLSRFSE